MPTQHEIFKNRMAENFDGLWRERRLPASELTDLNVMDMDEAEGRIRTRFRATPNLLNAMGFVHGGLLGTMLDDTISLAGTIASGFKSIMLTHEMKTNFVRSAKPGSVYGEGHVVHLGKTLAFLEGRLTDEDGRLLATATASARPFLPR